MAWRYKNRKLKRRPRCYLLTWRINFYATITFRIHARIQSSIIWTSFDRRLFLQRIMHQYPLHRISYCADDKGEKKFFSFIAKEEDAERHTCFVFVSDKLAEEITLTIGQAFDLAYRRFLETSGKDLETQRRCMVLQQKIKRLEHENNVYRQRLQDVAAIKGSVS